MDAGAFHCGHLFALTAEALLNPGEPAWTLPFTACHELAHARGVAGELEANLVAYYACRSLGSSAFAHSANLCMLRYALGELYLRDESLWQAACQKLSAAAPARNGLHPRLCRAAKRAAGRYFAAPERGRARAKQLFRRGGRADRGGGQNIAAVKIF